MLPTSVRRMATMGLIGLPAGCSSGPAPGTTALTDFTDMSTTVTILVTVTTDPFHQRARSRSTISTRTRRLMSMATAAIQAMTEAANTLPDSRAEAIPAVAAVTPAAEDIARER
jgi:hypothetical protein